MSAFVAGDLIQIYRSAGIPSRGKGLRAGTIATVIADPVSAPNIANGYDGVVRLLDGRVGAIHSVQWRKLPPLDDEADEECSLSLNGSERT